MIVTVRIEAEGSTLDEIIKDLDAAQKALKLPKEMKTHDEHYHRVHDTLFKGRRLFKPGEKGLGMTWMPDVSSGTGAWAGGMWTVTSSANTSSSFLRPQNT